MRSLNHILRSSGIALLVIGIAATAGARWPVRAGGSDDDSGIDTVTAESGNVYVLGNFRGVADFGGQELNSEGSDDVFVVKYDETGAVVWTISAGGSSIDRGEALVLDSAENLYVVGYFHGTITFGSAGFGGAGGGVLSLDADGPYADAFVGKVDSAGEWKWVRRLGGQYVDEAYDIDFHPGNDTASPPVPASVFIGGKYICDFGLYDDVGNLEVGPLDHQNRSTIRDRFSWLVLPRFPALISSIWIPAGRRLPVEVILHRAHTMSTILDM